MTREPIDLPDDDEGELLVSDTTVARRVDTTFDRRPGDSHERTELLDMREECLASERAFRSELTRLDKELKAKQEELRFMRSKLTDAEKRRDSIERQLVRVKKIANGERVVGRRPKLTEPLSIQALLANLSPEERMAIMQELKGE